MRVPDEWRVKYLKREEIIKRLRNGEEILRSVAMFPASRHGVQNIYFRDDMCNIKINTKTFEKLKNDGIIELRYKTGMDGIEYWKLRNP